MINRQMVDTVIFSSPPPLPVYKIQILNDRMVTIYVQATQVQDTDKFFNPLTIANTGYVIGALIAVVNFMKTMWVVDVTYECCGYKYFP